MSDPSSESSPAEEAIGHQWSESSAQKEGYRDEDEGEQAAVQSRIDIWRRIGLEKHQTHTPGLERVPFWHKELQATRKKVFKEWGKTSKYPSAHREAST